MTSRTRRSAGRPRLARLVRLIRWNEQDLVPVIIQDQQSRQVLTLAYLNRQALTKSLATGLVHVFRRSQGRLMLKGEQSGHTQRLRQVLVDCEGKSLVLLVRQRVAACHAGYFSCYFRRLAPSGQLTVTGRRVFDPARVYARTPRQRRGKPRR